MKLDISTIDFTKQNGLVPAIIQDAKSKAVLMLGFMNKEALEKTLKDNTVTFFSRSKNRLWQKGESSGNYLEVVEIKIDCDNDSLLILANPKGPTCHTGKDSCFGIAIEEKFTLDMLFQIIEKRKKEMPAGSYTASLISAGMESILAKVEEESLEVLQAARSEGPKRLIEESSDLIYHLFVLLSSQNISISEIEDELKRRN